MTNLAWDPYILRWDDPVVITGTVFNAGWYTSTATTVQVNAAISDTIYQVLDSTEVANPFDRPLQILHSSMPAWICRVLPARF